ncbi:hypothetical protein SEA_VANLEE_77 [Gordonia phage VanLee]|uniref:Uncharacterized protein n=1 Tax=Gordonia phage VanLee TaxID=2845816 RepID=A0A8F2DA87_9CAUD|nr:hypothetical protein QEH49_gp077 [Gordonia phage VanLee]QWS68194.1 hypothetical protein SEA_VANLEE_77 [Gordonia phage VanLee]
MDEYEWDECDHPKVGTISAGDHRTGPHASVRCCSTPACIGRASRYVHARTGVPAQPLLTYAAARAGSPS